MEHLGRETKHIEFAAALRQSHTHTIPFPSETDVKLAFYPEIPSIIISLKEKDPVVKAFRIGKEAIYLEEIEVIH